MPIALNNIGYKLYLINGAWDVLIAIIVAIFWVETKGRTLEEVDEIFDGQSHSTVTDLDHEHREAVVTSATEVTKDGHRVLSTEQ
jgi:hypothetical protein